MIKRERFQCSIAGIAELLERFYEEYPAYRGSTPNRIFNEAVRDWLIHKLNEKDILKARAKLNKESLNPTDNAPVV